MVGRLVYLVIFAAVAGLVLATAGCGGGAQVRPDTEPPAEGPEEKPEEIEGPEAPEEKPEEAPADETELEKKAKEEIAAAVAKAKEFSGEKKFDEALAELNKVVEKYGANLLLVAEARELITETEAAKTANAEAMRRQAADQWLQEKIAASRDLTAQKKFDEALKSIETIPEEYAYDEVESAIQGEKDAVAAAKKAYEDELAKMKAAEDRFGRLPEQIAEFAEKKEFDKVYELLDKYIEEFSDTEWADKARELRGETETAEAEWNAYLDKKQKSKDLFEETMAGATQLAADKKFEDAKKLIKNYPVEYAEFGYGPQLEGKLQEVDGLEQAHKKAMHEEAAKKAYDALISELAGLVGQKKFAEALKRLDAYPEEYNDTQWLEMVTRKRTDIQVQKENYEKEQARKKKAREEADKAIAEAGESVKKKEFDKALQTLRAYPEEFKDTDANADIVKEIGAIEEQKKKYEKDQMTMGIVIAVVIVVLLIVVIAISSAGRKKKGAPSLAAEEPEEAPIETAEEFIEDAPEAPLAEGEEPGGDEPPAPPEENPS